MNAMIDDGLLPAWPDPVHDAQASFRCVLKAMAEPGVIQPLPVRVEAPFPLMPATAAMLLTLADFETPVWLPEAANTPETQAWLRFHCGCPLVAKEDAAQFAVLLEPSKGLHVERYAQGSMEYPDRSTTLLVQVPSLDKGPARVLSGPGIKSTRMTHIAGLPHDFDVVWKQNHAVFPLGVDIVLCCDNAIVGLPRTTNIQSERAECM